MYYHTKVKGFHNYYCCIYRCHVIEQFNKGLYDYVIATDELPDSAPINGNPLEGKSGRVAGKKRKRKDTEYGVSRGIDFQC